MVAWWALDQRAFWTYSAGVTVALAGDVQEGVADALPRARHLAALVLVVDQDEGHAAADEAAHFARRAR